MNAMNIDLISTFVLLGLVALMAVAYSVRLALKGPAHFDRVDRQGGAVLLAKGLMEMGYWGLQPLARLLITLRVAPHSLSWTALLFGLAAGLALIFGHFGLGAAFACCAGLMDSLDGMVARSRGMASAAGGVLDSTLDRYVEFFFLFGLAVYYRELVVVLALVLFTILGSFMVSYSSAKAEAIHVTPPRGSMKRTERVFYLILGAGLSPLSILWIETAKAPPPLGYPMIITLGLVAILSNLSAIRRLRAVARAARMVKEG